ncbi:mechanosensitive ion channel family protein [Oxalobacteraceae bacterium CAVE-383]|nr:mechanosensitive ion channel family protein [Oxalobacteraceae bacterium CAVE-383]
MPSEIASLLDWLAGHIELHAAAAVGLLLTLAWIANRLVKRVLARGLYRQLLAAFGIDRAGSRPLNVLIARLAQIVPALIIYGGIELASPRLDSQIVAILRNIAQASIVLAVALALGSMLSLAEQVYQGRPGAHNRPIKGYLQIGKIAVYAIATVLMIATLSDRSPLILLSGLGAMAAVLMLVFQDTLLSMVASVQISSSGIVRVGDWIEMPQLHADGAVIDIALHTVKVQNWDLTITTIPTKRLISEAFKNWRGMQESGGRRIKRALLIDQNSIRFLDQAGSSRLRGFSLLDDYLGGKQHELDVWNAELAQRGVPALNARKVSNIGTFRSYVERYLRRHGSVRQDMSLIVRQLNPTPEGLPLEIVCFANVTAWAAYEAVQADIFDHLLAIIPEFGLRLYQRPAGADMQSLQGQPG